MTLKGRMRCRVCDTDGVMEFLSLGEIPRVNAFLTPSELSREKTYPLDLCFCPSCSLVQLKSFVPPDELFSEYFHLSSASASNVSHLFEVADLVRKQFRVDSKTKILELGSNDGTLLAQFKGVAGVVLGMDPARNLLAVSGAKGVETIADFFSQEVAKRVVSLRGQFHLVLALNVVAHTPDVVDLLRGIHTVLAPGGTLVMEVAYALDTILRGEFDTIYHEHMYCFSLHSLARTLKQAGLVTVYVAKIPTQGGSLRVFARREDDDPEIGDSVIQLHREEMQKGIADLNVYKAVGPKVEQLKHDLRASVRRAKLDYGRLVGLGAPARGVVILNYCKIGRNYLKVIIDDTPLKQGKLVPGVRIPVTSWQILASDHPTAFLLLSWNYKEEMLEKLRRYIRRGIVIIPLPGLEVIDIESA